MKFHPLTIIVTGLLICSIGFNILVIRKNYELEQKQKKPVIIILEPDKLHGDITTI